jgi:predicted phage terminase large subunit-like protein
LSGQEAEASVRAGLRRRSLLRFVLASFPAYLAGWFHRDVCARLERFSAAVAARQSPRVIFFAPPRHGKSFVASERFPAWHLGHHSDHEIIVAGYSLTSARKRSKKARAIARSELMADTFPSFALDPSAQSVDEWYTDAEGRYQAVGTGGSIVGGGAHILLIDDPIKGWKDALSRLKRDSIWDWYQGDAYTRLAPGGGVLIIETPWHEDDLCGRLLRMAESGDGDQWEVIRYPAIAVRDELHRKVGEPLHEERWPLNRLEAIRTVVGPRKWGALYRCDPQLEGGNIWKPEWWRFWTRSPLTEEQEASGKWMVLPQKFDKECQSWDLSLGSMTQTSSFNVGQAWGRCKADLFLLDELRLRGGINEVESAMRDLTYRWPSARTKYVEDAALGKPLTKKLQHDIPGLKLVSVDANKAARMEACVPDISAGNVYLPDPRTHAWVRDWIEECAQAPLGENNDRSDAASQAIVRMRFKPAVRVGAIGQRETARHTGTSGALVATSRRLSRAG